MSSMCRPTAPAVKSQEPTPPPGKGESAFVTGLVELEKQRLASQAAASAVDDTLPDLLYDTNPSPKPPTDLPHSANRSMRRPGRT